MHLQGYIDYTEGPRWRVDVSALCLGAEFSTLPENLSSRGQHGEILLWCLTSRGNGSVFHKCKMWFGARTWRKRTNISLPETLTRIGGYLKFSARIQMWVLLRFRCSNKLKLNCRNTITSKYPRQHYTIYAFTTYLSRSRNSLKSRC